MGKNGKENWIGDQKTIPKTAPNEIRTITYKQCDVSMMF